MRLRCPVCGEGRLFRGWFRMHEHCSECGLKYERDPGYFLGSIYFNYGLTALLVTIAYVVLLIFMQVPAGKLLVPMALFCVVFPLWFFRYARSLWMGFDQYFDPREAPAER